MEILTDVRISELIREAKSIPDGLLTPSKLMPTRNGHYQKGFDCEAESSNRFVVKVRQSCINVLNFSVILGYMVPGTYTIFRLRRYNGKSHFHTNTLEREAPFYDFHVHTATERYQKAPGFDPDHFAEITNRFWNLESAIATLLNDCGFGSTFEGTPLFPKVPRA